MGYFAVQNRSRPIVSPYSLYDILQQKFTADDVIYGINSLYDILQKHVKIKKGPNDI